MNSLKELTEELWRQLGVTKEDIKRAKKYKKNKRAKEEGIENKPLYIEDFYESIHRKANKKGKSRDYKAFDQSTEKIPRKNVPGHVTNILNRKLFGSSK